MILGKKNSRLRRKYCVFGVFRHLNFSRAFGARQRLSLTTKIVQIQTIVPVLENIPLILVRSSYKIVLFH